MQSTRAEFDVDGLRNSVRLLPRHHITQRAVRAVSVEIMLKVAGGKRSRSWKGSVDGRVQSSLVSACAVSAPHGQGRLGICLSELLDIYKPRDFADHPCMPYRSEAKVRLHEREPMDARR